MTEVRYFGEVGHLYRLVQTSNGPRWRLVATWRLITAEES